MREIERKLRKDIEDENHVILCPTCQLYQLIGLKYRCLAKRLKDEEDGLAFICEDYLKISCKGGEI